MRRKTSVTAALAAASLVAALCGCASRTTTVPAQAAAKSAAAPATWPGTYRGVVPCADCEGIETTITLAEDRSFTIRTRYLGKAEKVSETKGTFTWNEARDTIRLRGVTGGPDRYLISEGALIQLDLQGNRITGDLAARYELRRAADAAGAAGEPEAPAAPPTPAPESLTAPLRWRLIELRGQPVGEPARGAQAPYLVFEKEGNRVRGSGGCNDFLGSCEYRSGGRLRVANLAGTKKACAGLATESEFLKALEAADNYIVDGTLLRLHRARTAPLAVLEAVAEEE